MENGIIKRQNSNENIQKLASQRQIYSKAKKVLGVQIITQVIIVIILSLLRFIFNDSFLNAYSIKKENFNLFIIICSVTLVLLDVIFINPQIKKLKSLAASIQEDFDCTVLLLPWNDVKVDKPDIEIISKYAREYYKNNKTQELINWYTPKEIETLPINVARIICQRTNCLWDNYLRKKYNQHIIICTILIFLILLFIGLISDLTLSIFITNVFFPFFPVLIFSIRQVQDNNNSIKLLKTLKNKANKYWERVLSNECTSLNDLSRKLQNEIFDSRKNSPLIFDWYYRKYKSSQQIDTDYSGEQMVTSYKSRLHED
ncbi:S-4TM family putative pore-forming effector [Sporolactobacillus laevolacticus]|uniref:S-4TM family putative pore-forming effector n=1 Tax=Sporolactobacillus laevolacticus TaxID=33018 RepID=UPI0025B6259F|nr:S-4TM family putative pore-forming effector [Sporolactobacillus laevolacticus]MDN3956162.1 S-4TM family putative pore-forming effector [Sporolactobacillus laevolacticus]